MKKQSMIPTTDEIADAVLNATWPWRKAPRPRGAVRRFTAKRWFGVLLPLVVAGVFARKGHHVTAVVVLCVGLSYGAVSLLAPKLAGVLDVGLVRFGAWVGLVLRWVLLVPFFFLVFGTAGLALRLFKRDPLARPGHPCEGSYWAVLSGSQTDAAGYRRQY